MLRRLALVAPLLVACTPAPLPAEPDRPTPPVDTVVATPAPPASVPTNVPAVPAAPRCTLPPPAAPAIAEDGLVLRKLTEHAGQLQLLSISGRVVLVGTRTSPDQTFTGGGGHSWVQPGGDYRNQFFVLEGATVRPEPTLQAGLWPNQDVWGSAGHWPHIDIWSTNYDNTAWESVHFRWLEGRWEARYNDDTVPWRGGFVGASLRDGKRAFGFEPSAEALGVPETLCEGRSECDAGLVVASPRDIYANGEGCEWGSFPDSCNLKTVLHWCAPATGFEEYPLPETVLAASIHAVPGSLLVTGHPLKAGDAQYVLREGSWHKLTPPVAVIDLGRLRAVGDVLWYLGDEGLHQLQGTAWRRVLSWALTRTEKGAFVLRLSGDDANYHYAGMATADDGTTLMAARVAPAAGAKSQKTVIFTLAPAE